MLIKILEVLMFAIAITILMAWGTIKKQRQSQELGYKLINQCEQKIVKAFKKNNLMNQSELIDEISDIKVSLFWSRKKAIVENPKLVLDGIINDFIEKGWIVEGKQKLYTWIKKED